ncbi:MAG TPA: hypothetical protein VFG42_05360 [Baekduia sp.]|uniref:hypothetical protein n=1 Tax=Baekduia sp. TaxID=2600305 RepID=UPI002D774858|nr:hypothetical protein [Baekduia sp.]HET6506194.1 hypothetical protein [Baekduia sp.]
MDDHIQVRRGWIYLDGARQDDGTIKIGTGQELKLNPIEAIGERKNSPIPLGGAIWKASVQRLVFWRR